MESGKKLSIILLVILSCCCCVIVIGSMISARKNHYKIPETTNIVSNNDVGVLDGKTWALTHMNDKRLEHDAFEHVLSYDKMTKLMTYTTPGGIFTYNVNKNMMISQHTNDHHYDILSDWLMTGSARLILDDSSLEWESSHLSIIDDRSSTLFHFSEIRQVSHIVMKNDFYGLVDVATGTILYHNVPQHEIIGVGTADVIGVKRIHNSDIWGTCTIDKYRTLVAIGRPYLNRVFDIVPVSYDNPSVWNHIIPPTDSVPIDEPVAKWTKVAQHEHGSILSFAQVIMDLVQLGSPPELLIKAADALKEEIEHTKIALGIVHTLTGEYYTFKGSQDICLTDFVKRNQTDTQKENGSVDVFEEECVHYQNRGYTEFASFLQNNIITQERSHVQLGQDIDTWCTNNNNKQW